jgi:hypothetical protein
VRGSSTAKLALHRDWMSDKGYAAGAVVEMHLPEQGLSGPFRITSIKHLLPQKRPAEENEPADFAFQPVTGIFAHRSNDVWRLAFDSGDTLGVTYNHPIYSITADDWRLAGELEIGEEVLTYTGAATLCSKALLPGAHVVYNLEVKDWHNFLVGELGVVVHNSCWDKAAKYASGELPKSEIWALKGYPQIFQRGNIIEQIMRKSTYKTWNYTGIGPNGLGISNYWLIDFYKGNKVVSLKSTKLTDGADWANQNAQHIKNLNARKNAGSFPSCNTQFSNCNSPSETISGITNAELHIVVEDLSAINVNAWKQKIMEKLAGEVTDGFTVKITTL